MESNQSPDAALRGVRIVDLTTVVFGPYATQTLADYGADVIKIETPAGDGTRFNGPAAQHGMSSMFLGSNRNKRSVVLDLKQPEGRQALHALCDTADVFVHNIRPQKLARLGLSAAALRARNPRLVFAALHGFGEGGPYAGKPAYDDTIQALSGAADLVRRQSGTPGYLPTVMADKVAAQMAVHAIMAALFQRERTGLGQEVEVPMFESVTAFLLVEHFFARQLQEGPAPDRATEQELGYPRSLAAWRRPYRAADGYVCIMPYTDENWHRFFTAVERPDLLADPRFLSHASRSRHVAELLACVGDIVTGRTTADWLALCKAMDIPCARLNRLDELEEDPHLRAVDFFQSLPLGADTQLRFPRFPLRLSASQVAPAAPPRLGEHTAEVLAGLGLPDCVLGPVLATAMAAATPPAAPAPGAATP
ncbi:CoA transferase [Rhodoferax koreense]|uniref:CoA transferase n=1 Tax=Rhodoferax koreensis TaxID=1842727 RepID=A0A1P8K161_9BURK|nr:CoA transferase [Rhodoferax koreense]APW39737.1 CoA transferase [Rhodoferax koreense]